MSIAPVPLSGSAQAVQKALDGFDLKFEVLELPASTRTAQEAAQAVGCAVEQIAKSLIFHLKVTSEPLLIIASGVNRVDIPLVSASLGQAIQIADADYARQATGFAIGGIPPIAHVQPIRTLLDQTLRSYDEIWAAAGTPHAVFRLSPAALEQITGGEWMAVG